MIAAARERVADWIAPGRHVRREDPIEFESGFSSKFFGGGLGGNQPSTRLLLKESQGVGDMATRAIANRMGSLNPLVKQTMRQSEGTLKDEILDDHQLKVLLDRPHPNYTRRQMFRLTTQHVVTAGEAYWLKIRNQLRVPFMLQPMPPASVAPRIEGGLITGYWVQDGSGESIAIDANEVIRFWWVDPESLVTAEGYLAPNSTTSDAHLFASQHLRSHYQWDATPNVILKAGPDAVKPDQKQWREFRKDWLSKYHRRKGKSRGVPAALPFGWDAILTALTSGADITPLLEHWTSNELMNMGVPPSILGRVVSGDRSSAETNQFVFDLHTVTPIADMMADALTLQLAGDFDDAIFVAFEEFVSQDKEFNLLREGQDLDKKVRTAQQILIARGEDPDLAPWGGLPVGSIADTPYTGEERELPGFTESIDDLDEPEDLDEPLDDEDLEPDDDEGDDRSRRTARRASIDPNLFSKTISNARVMRREKKFTPAFTKQMRAIFNRQLEEVLDNLEDLLEDGVLRTRASAADIADGLFDETGWGPLFNTRTEPLRKKATLFAAREGMTLVGLEATDFIFTEQVAAKLTAHQARFVSVVNETTKLRIQKAVTRNLVTGVQEGLGSKQIAKLITKSMKSVFKTRRNNAVTIARTEMHRATQTGQLDAFAQADVPFKRWIDAADNDVRETHIEGLISPVRFEDDFLLPSGEVAAHPNDPRLSAGESINCRCDVAPEFETPPELE